MNGAAQNREELERGFNAATKPRSVHDIVAAFVAAMALIDEADGEITDELAAELDALTGSEIGDKAEAYKAVCGVLAAEADACKKMAQPYLERAKRKLAHHDKLKQRLFDALTAMGLPKAEGLTGGARLQKNGGQAALEILVPEASIEKLFPERFLQTVVVLDREELVSALREGESLSVPNPDDDNKPVELARVTRGKHLRWV